MVMTKVVTIECEECESSFTLHYVDMMTSKEYPEYCPFCGAEIQNAEEHSEDEFEQDEEYDYDEGETYH